LVGGKELSKDFPLRIYSYVHFWYNQKNDLSKKNFIDTFLDTGFNANVAQLIRNDPQNGSAELGGV
jgi:hypothetical protein